MNDRELLELAAKAAGFQLAQDGSRMDMLTNDPWNPLADDGDALRLAVKLGISFRDDYNYPDGERVIQVGCIFGNTLYGDSEPCGADPYAAARRVIVRAAAEIGNAVTPSNMEVTGNRAAK